MWQIFVTWRQNIFEICWKFLEIFILNCNFEKKKIFLGKNRQTFETTELKFKIRLNNIYIFKVLTTYWFYILLEHYIPNFGGYRCTVLPGACMGIFEGFPAVLGFPAGNA
jgi:hypothetical protein